MSGLTRLCWNWRGSVGTDEALSELEAFSELTGLYWNMRRTLDDLVINLTPFWKETAERGRRMQVGGGGAGKEDRTNEGFPGSAQ